MHIQLRLYIFPVNHSRLIIWHLLRQPVKGISMLYHATLYHHKYIFPFIRSFQSFGWWHQNNRRKERLEKGDQEWKHSHVTCSKGTLRHPRKVINLLHCAVKLHMSAIFCECLWVVHHHCDPFDFIAIRQTNLSLENIHKLGICQPL